MANIPITDNTTLLNTLKAKAQALPAKGSGSTDAPDLSGITAAAEDILAGKKSVDATGAEITGTMTNNGAWTSTKTSNGSVTIPAGYHNGNGKVTVNVSTTTTNGELDTPTVNFSLTTGKFSVTSKVKTAGYISTSATATNSWQLTTDSGGTITPGTSSKTAVAANRYTTAATTVAGDSNLVAANIKSGVSIFGVNGTLKTGATVTSITTNRSWNSAVDSSYDYHRIAYFSLAMSGAKYVMCLATATSGTSDGSTNSPDSVEAIIFDVTNKTCYIRTSDSLATIETEIGGGTHPSVIFKNDSSNGFAVFVKGTYLCYDTYRTFIVT